MDMVTAWVKPPPPAQGLDHLGTQQPCIAYYTQLLPGITNVTNRARYYSLYPWLVWALGERYPKVDLPTYEDLFRKADCLLTLIAERHARVLDEPADLHGATMTGRDTLVPAVAQLEGNKKLLLSRFATREKVPERYFQNRFGGLGQYYLGPLQELGLLDAGSGPWLRYTRQRGQVVAEAVQGAVKVDRFFKVVEGDGVSLRDLDDLSGFCCCGLASSADEHRHLVDLFFDRRDEHGAAGAQRRCTLGLLLSLVDLTAGKKPTWVDVSLARGALYGRSFAGTPWQVAPILEDTARGWQEYERNDLLSTAVQAAFIVALRVLEDSATAYVSAQDFGEAFALLPSVRSCLKNLGASSVQGVIQKLASELPPLSAWDNPAHEFQLCASLIDEYGQGSDRSVLWSVFQKALRVIFSLAARTDLERSEYGFSPFPVDFLRDHPINLESFRANLTSEWREMPLRDFTAWLVADWGISTHLRVALRKLRANPQATFRVRPSEQGLQVVEGIPLPAPTNPRLRQALQVLRDIGAVHHDLANKTTHLTPLGRELLAHAIAH